MLFAEFFYALKLTIFFSMLFFLFVPSDKQRFENLKKEIEKDRKKYENRLLGNKIKSEFGESVVDNTIGRIIDPRWSDPDRVPLDHPKLSRLINRSRRTHLTIATGK